MFNPVKFIEEVKVRPALYSPEVTADRTEKMDLWKEVGAALFPDWDTCNKATVYDRVLQLRKKWRSLRDTYKRELRQRKKKNYPAPRKVYQHFKRMSFLGGFDGEVSPAEETEDEDQLLYPMAVQNDNADDTEEERETPPKKAKRKKRKRASSPSLQATEEYEIPTMSLFSSDMQDDSDSDKLFLMSFLPEMRQLPSNIKMWARAQIANIMQEAVNNHYNNVMPRTENCVIIKQNIDSSQ